LGGGSFVHQHLIRDNRERDVSLTSGEVGESAPPVKPLDPDWANSLARTRPELSAATPMTVWQKSAVLTLCAVLTGGLLLSPHALLSLALVVLFPVFVAVAVLRLFALGHLVAPPQPIPALDTVLQIPEAVPRYTVLVPLYREREVIPQLIQALGALDYPADRFEIVLAIEADDDLTGDALNAVVLPENAHVVVVPSGLPRTKPRALMYALQFARGEYVVVYDAEDIPDPGQLRQAVAVFRQKRGRIGCVQAQLNIYNPRSSWLTRQFALEYTALFDAILPAIERLNLPVPLGGTSNHFPRAVLDEVGGWDPHNVTEDADLGIRLARAGWRVEILRSTTWEEAPNDLRVWFGQRVRWLKGWMQTYLVHNRDPRRLKDELGITRFLGLQVLMGGLLLSALIHPLFYIVAAYDVYHGAALFAAPAGTLPEIIWWAGIINFVAAYTTAVFLLTAAIVRRKRASLAVHALLVPVYWLLVSAAAYRAILQLFTAPYWWEKTVHTGRSRAVSRTDT
jgi:glycosyltransferase XagB